MKAKIIPPTNVVVPLISKYLLFTFMMNILCVMNTCIVLNVYYKSNKLNKAEHPWIHFFFVKLLPKMLLMQNNIQKSIIFDSRLIKKCKDRLRTSVLESPLFDLKYFNRNERKIEKKKKNSFRLYENFDYDDKKIWNKEK